RHAHFRPARVMALMAALAVSNADAAPWLAPGALTVRHDIELLADAGVLRGPITTWPISWPDVARDVNAARLPDDASDPLRQALVRLQGAARRESRAGLGAAGVRVAGARDPDPLRGFSD